MGLRARLDKARRLVAEAGLDALVVSRPSNIFYFTGFKGGSRLLVPADGEPAILVGGVDLVAAEQHFSGAGVQVVHIKLGEKLDDVMLRALEDMRVKALGYDELPLPSYKRLTDELKPERLEDLSKHIWSLRKAKEPWELELIRRACQMAAEGMRVASELVEPGRTELEVAGEVERAMRRAGSEAHPFDVIIASGPNSALPHARCSERRFKKGDLVVVDIGATCGGYVSDMTRTFVVGEPEPWQEEVHELVKRAQEEGRGAVRAGVKACDVDRAARAVIEGAGYGQFFVHSTGHGLGIEVHEPPRLSPGSEEELGANFTITVEPGVYLPGRGGVRIEDTVLVLPDGHEVLTRFPYELRP